MRAFVLASFALALLWLLVASVLRDFAGFRPSLELLEAVPLALDRAQSTHRLVLLHGWAGNAMLGVSLWLTVRLVRSRARWLASAWTGLALWNAGLVFALAGLLGAGERPLAELCMLLGIALVGAAIWCTLLARRAAHLYVSVWYVASAYLGFPVLALGALLLRSGGLEAQNALGLWLSAISLAAIYYLLPKILGRPVYSYTLAFFGFFGLLFFHALCAVQPLIGGTLPSWAPTSSLAANVLLLGPVVAIAVNHHMTVAGRLAALRYSPALAFVVLGALAYTVRSLQDVAHAAGGAPNVSADAERYAFASLVLTGAIYHIAPRLMAREWPFSALVRWHVWLVLGAMLLQGLGIAAGELGRALWVQEAAGLLRGVGHVLLACHFVWLVGLPQINSAATHVWHDLAPVPIDLHRHGAPAQERTS